MAPVTIHDLIEAYCSEATTKLAQLKSALGVEGSLLWHIRGERLSPPSGMAGGIHYRIHGAGVWMKDHNGAVDVDLGENDFTEAFDAWRLHLYAVTRKRFAQFSPLEVVKAQLERLIASGEVGAYPYLLGFFVLKDR